MQMTPEPAPRSRRCRGPSAHRQAGAAAVEFALIGSVLILLLLAIVDFGQLFWTNLTLQHAVREGARYAVTGQTGLAPVPGNATARCDAAVAKVREQAMGLYERTSAAVTFKTIGADGSIQTIGAGSCYGAGQVILLQVDAAARAWTPMIGALFTDGEYRFQVVTAMKNEAFR